VYTIPVEGGQEKRLTDVSRVDDGPEYSPDGRYIYFNSIRTGQMKIWRMDADGRNQRQLTPNDAYGDWFPHPSPDGKWIVFLSYDKSVEGHPAKQGCGPEKNACGRGGTPEVLAALVWWSGNYQCPLLVAGRQSLCFCELPTCRPLRLFPTISD